MVSDLHAFPHPPFTPKLTILIHTQQPVQPLEERREAMDGWKGESTLMTAHNTHTSRSSREDLHGPAEMEVRRVDSLSWNGEEDVSESSLEEQKP
ncbi:hypothetical protein VIGAN_11163700 [Vigna angularis var. angularis]|uniref:Uncharacterized protein n=1 Tax=Vigna angularis var. angularis TaxID=157739 RepID=A0A0S3TB56_PHAAN|nr:hypothetical protein VIGAN_11163700 [Vigna angularis var. angularis]